MWLSISSVQKVVGQAAGAAAVDEPHPLALKQEMIRDRFKRFHDRLFALQKELSAREPENAARLARAIERAAELGLSDRMERIIELLHEPSTFTDAVDQQNEWIVEAEQLLSILLRRDADDRQRQEEMDRLEAFKKTLGEILQQQHALREASGQSAQAKRLAQQMEQAARRLDQLIQRQQGVSRSTQDAPPGDASRMNQSREAQQELAEEAKQLAKDLEQLERQAQAQAKDAPFIEEARKALESAGRSVQSGAREMSGAAEQLERPDKQQARQAQDRAEQALENAKRALEQTRKQFEEQQKSRTREAAGQQRANARQARGLSDQMRGQPSQGGNQNQKGQQGQQGRQRKQSGKQSQGSQSPAPGTENLDQAEQHMEDAAEDLERDGPDDATEDQDLAIKELEQAQRELEEALNQLRKEQRAEMLRDLENRFRDMLGKQRAINEATAALHQLGSDRLGRAEKLELSELSVKQHALAERAATCVHILEEEGTTIAFPRVVAQVAQDMAAVSQRLAAFSVGILTQNIQRQIVETLEQLLEALQRMQQENEQRMARQPSGGDSPNAPLLPTSAELKLLRLSQLRVNDRTAAIHEARDQENEPDEALRAALLQTAQRQRECAEIARQMRDRPE